MTVQKPKPWELKLSPAHLVILLGLVTGSMAGAFYLGFSSGQHIGYESALHATLTNMARLPIPTDDVDAASSDDVTSEVYAKLAGTAEKDDPIPAKNGAEKEKEMPELGAIASTDSLPILPDSVLPSSSSAPAEHNPSVLKKSNAADANETLGAVAAHAESSRSSVAASASSAAVHAQPPEASQKSVAAIAPKPVTDDAKSAASAKASQQASSAKAAAVVPPKKETAAPQNSSKAAQPTQVAKKEGTIPVRATIPSGWYVQVAAPRHLEEANAIAGSVRKIGVPVMIESAQVRGEDYYRVIAGPQSQRAGAEKILAQIKSKASVKGDPFVRAVK